MRTHGGLEELRELLISWISSVINLEDAVNPNAYTANDRELIEDVFCRFIELAETVDRLDLCLTFIRGTMPKRKGVKLYEYLMYHITFYFQEVYILKERLKSYANTIKKWRKHLGLSVNEEAYKTLIGFVSASLSQIIEVRGDHVHNRAFTDDRMRVLSTFSFMAVHAPDRHEWKELAQSLYQVSRAEWIDQLSKNREDITRIVDVYCEFMCRQVLDVLPNSLSKSKNC